MGIACGLGPGPRRLQFHEGSSNQRRRHRLPRTPCPGPGGSRGWLDAGGRRPYYRLERVFGRHGPTRRSRSGGHHRYRTARAFRGVVPRRLRSTGVHRGARHTRGLRRTGRPRIGRGKPGPEYRVLHPLLGDHRSCAGRQTKGTFRASSQPGRRTAGQDTAALGLCNGHRHAGNPLAGRENRAGVAQRERA